MPNSPSEPWWLPVEAAIGFNKAAVELTNEPHWLRDVGLLESALARPQQWWAYQRVEDIALLAATLLHGIACNHSFEQGNKRTAFAACVEFVRQNGYHFTIPDTAARAAYVRRVVAKVVTEEETGDWLYQFMEPG